MSPGQTPNLRLSPLRVSMTRTEISPDQAETREQFRDFHAIFCKQMLHPEFLATLQRLCDEGNFISDQTGPGHRFAEFPQRAGRALNLVLSRPETLRWMEETTGCGTLSAVHGRVAQIFPQPGDELIWHDDIAPGEDRRLAIVILLGTAEYEGGEFEMRPKRGELLLRHKHTDPGSALIFSVDPLLQHRVLPLTRGGPRRVFAGWAMGAPLA